MFQLLALTQAGQPSVGARRRSFPRRLLQRITTLAIAAVAVLVAQVVYSQPVKADQAERPNIVLIMADDMGYECVSANGGAPYKTPHLDKLAEGGMRFTHCHSQPICTPTRVQIMTGRYNSRNYVKFGVLDPQEKTFGNMMRDAGYATCIVGKWQLKGGFEGPKNFGFDEYCLWQLTRRPNRYPNPGLEINGKEVDYKNGEYGPDVVTDYACDFMERNKDKPFFLYYPMMLPHWPFEPTPDSKDW
ncbi:MAG: sulfatase-like hydrolase/transferase, partial [Pirellulales bacterium]|nr:sulfatase-like hydrolase/transferase [Pirellulales bacterium]